MRIPLYVNVQCFNVNHFMQGYAQLNVNSNRLASTDSTDLRKVMAEKIPAFQEEVSQLLDTYDQALCASFAQMRKERLQH